MRRASRTVVASQPQARAVQPWKQDALVDIGLVQFVANFLLELCGDHDSLKHFLMLVEPAADAQIGAGTDRQKGSLVDDAVVQRKRLEKCQKRLLR